jgi:hypothetical protein
VTARTHRIIRAIASLASCCAFAGAASAAAVPGQGTWESELQGRLWNGSSYDAYYDTALNITWLANGALAGARMSWQDSAAWAAGLNIEGVTGWHLPAVTDPSAACVGSFGSTNCGLNSDPASSALAHMFYVTLGNKAVYDTSSWTQVGFGMTNSGPFTDIKEFAYWLDAASASTKGAAWYFDTYFGSQYDMAEQGNLIYAWAVHDGDVSAGSTPAIPEPGTYALTLLGIGMLGLARRRKAA